jgi:CubicO group peptidase (beta-lactamase class C family)
MSSSTFSFEEVEASGAAATPYGGTLTGEIVEIPLEYEHFVLPVSPAGALWSNVEDMAQFAIMQLNRGVAPGGTRLVSEENLAETWQPQVEISSDASYGLGWIVEDYKGVTVLSHGGNTLGFTSELAFLPEHGIGIAILTNEQGSVLNTAVRARLMELLFEQEFETEELLGFQFEQIEEALAEFQESLIEEIDEEAIAPYIGSYTHEALGELTLALEDGILTADAGEFQVEIRATENDEGEIQYIATSQPLAGLPIEFSGAEEGQPVIVLGTGVVEYTFEKVE